MVFRSIMYSVFFLFFLTKTDPVQAGAIVLIENEDTTTIKTDTLKQAPTNEKFSYRKSKRFTAALLCLALGPFGMHRLYLGTTPRVAAAYSVTLGGVGIIPLVDLLAITFAKDISGFKNNPRFIMWGK